MAIDWARLGKDLRAAREKRGLSQEQFAEELSLRQSDISLLERGAKKRPGPEIMDKIRRYLDPARALQVETTGHTLPAPDEESVNDPTFLQVWAKIGAIWKHRKTVTELQWEALVKNVAAFHQPVEHAQRASGKSRARVPRNVTR